MGSPGLQEGTAQKDGKEPSASKAGRKQCTVSPLQGAVRNMKTSRASGLSGCTARPSTLGLDPALTWTPVLVLLAFLLKACQGSKEEGGVLAVTAVSWGCRPVLFLVHLVVGHREGHCHAFLPAHNAKMPFGCVPPGVFRAALWESRLGSLFRPRGSQCGWIRVESGGGGRVETGWHGGQAILPVPQAVKSVDLVLGGWSTAEGPR